MLCFSRNTYRINNKTMTSKRGYIRKGLILYLIPFLILLSSFTKLSAEELNWVKVASTNNKIQFIDPNSIKYNNKGILSVKTKYSEINPEDNTNINTDSYLIAIDCENRLFSKLPFNNDINKVKNWVKPKNDKLIKTTIFNSCSY